MLSEGIGIAGAEIRPPIYRELTRTRAAATVASACSVLIEVEMPRAPWRRSVFDWIIDLPLVIELWLLDRITGPTPETEADRIREQRMDRLRRAFPGIDVDGAGPANNRRNGGDRCDA